MLAATARIPALAVGAPGRGVGGAHEAPTNKAINRRQDRVLSVTSRSTAPASPTNNHGADPAAIEANPGRQPVDEGSPPYPGGVLTDQRRRRQASSKEGHRTDARLEGPFLEGTRASRHPGDEQGGRLTTRAGKRRGGGTVARSVVGQAETATFPKGRTRTPKWTDDGATKTGRCQRRRALTPGPRGKGRRGQELW